MWPVFVEVALILVKYNGVVSLVDDQDAVEQFAADGSDEALGDCVRPRRPHWRLDDPDIDRGEHGIEGGGELGVAVADEEPEAPIGLVEVHEQVAGLLGQPLPGGAGGDAHDMDAAGGVLDDEERVQPVQGDRVDVKQVAGPGCRGPAPGGTAPRSVRRVEARARSPPSAGSSRRSMRRSGSRGR